MFVLLHPLSERESQFGIHEIRNSELTMSYGVTVAHLTLDQLVLVRIQVGQQKRPNVGRFFYCRKVLACAVM